MIDINRDMPSFSSLNKWEQMIIKSIHRAYPMDIERIEEIFVTLDKNEHATRIRVQRECIYGYRIYK